MLVVLSDRKHVGDTEHKRSEEFRLWRRIASSCWGTVHLIRTSLSLSVHHTRFDISPSLDAAYHLASSCAIHLLQQYLTVIIAEDDRERTKPAYIVHQVWGP